VLLDSNLGVPLPDKSYGDDCSLTWKTIWVCLSFLVTNLDTEPASQDALDIFVRLSSY